jgi:K+-sensing histidine kinase KdpD
MGPIPHDSDPAPEAGDPEQSEAERTISELDRREALWIAAARAVSHDLRSPLTSIIAALQTMARLGPVLEADDHKRLLDSALAATERMRHVADDLLLAAGDESPAKAVPGTHLAALVREAAGSVPVESEPDLPAVTTHARRLARALTDLITGKHSAAESVALSCGSAGIRIEISPAPPADRHGFAVHLIVSAGGSIDWTDSAAIVSLPRHDPEPPAGLV